MVIALTKKKEEKGGVEGLKEGIYILYSLSLFSIIDRDFFSSSPPF